MSNPVTLNLVNHEGSVPAPDMLLVTPNGARNLDIVRVRVDADSVLERGTLLMSGTKDSQVVYLPCTKPGLAAAGGSFAILGDSVTLSVTDHADVAVYFDGDFNANAVIFPWETDVDDHDEQVTLARETLRKNKIFLRNTQR